MADTSDPRDVLDEGPLTPLHRITIKNMRASTDECVSVTVMRHARAEKVLAAREAYRGAGYPRVTLTVLFAHALASALSRHPDINAAVHDERRTRYRDVGLGLAVADGEGNLMVPVLARAQTYDVVALGDAVAELSERARQRQLALSDVRNGTFTLSSIGMVMEGGMGTAVIPQGQAGVLVIGGTERVPVVEGDNVVPGLVLPLSLTFDHRVANGVSLWTFFADLVQTIEGAAAPEGLNPDGP